MRIAILLPTLPALMLIACHTGYAQDPQDPQLGQAVDTDRFVVTGTVSSEARVPTLDEHGVLLPRWALPVETYPVRSATVIAIQEPDHKVVGRATTDADGAFSMPVEWTRAGNAQLVVLAASDTDGYNLAVQDCPMDDCPLGPSTYGSVIGEFDDASDQDLGSSTILISSEASGAFNILRVFQESVDFVAEHIGLQPPPLFAQWRAHGDTSCATSCYGSSDTIYLLGLDDDSDEFDHDIIMHEFGHFVEATYSSTGGGGGFHDGSPTDPRLAWSEGFCTWLGTAIPEDPYYLDTNADGGGWYDYSVVAAMGDPTAPLTQPASEDTVAELLYGLAFGDGTHQGAGPGAIMDVISRYFLSPNYVDRGVAGSELVDFLDGWTCREHGTREFTEALVNVAHQFPYDFAAPSVCEAPAGVPDYGETATAGGPDDLSPITPSRMSFRNTGPNSVSLDVTARSTLTSATVEIIVPDGITVQQPTDIEIGAFGPNSTRTYEFTWSGTAPPDARLAARLDMTLGSGSAYHMSTSYRLDGDTTPFTYGPDTSQLVEVRHLGRLRVYE